MSKHRNNNPIPQFIPRVVEAYPVIAPHEQKPANTYPFRSVKCSYFAEQEQDRTIEKLSMAGYDYFESISIPGGEMIMRFKRRI
jgi:hypothetical protein